MKILQYRYQHRNDFTAIIICEHCQSTQKLITGYDDAFYHHCVLPAIHCDSCGKNRAGECRAVPPQEEAAA